MVDRLDIVYRQERDRWVRGDKYLRPIARRILRGKRSNFSGMEKVVRNLLRGFSRRQVPYSYNNPLLRLSRSKIVISFGLGAEGLRGIRRSAPVIAAVGFPYPAELPDLCRQYNIRKYLQHSSWALDLVRSAQVYDDDIFALWPAGIDTDTWQPFAPGSKTTDVLLYDKVIWEHDRHEASLIDPIRTYLKRQRRSFTEIRYGYYGEEQFRAALAQCRVMIFLSQHETQGLAYQECLSCGVPVIAWDQGYWLDPVRFKYNRPTVRATSVPYFDERCGITFGYLEEFQARFDQFFENALRNRYDPRAFVLEHLSIPMSTSRMLDICRSV
ncbi:MAG: glycosyltransferase family 1 protein [Candidatus Binatia bacterium]